MAYRGIQLSKIRIYNGDPQEHEHSAPPASYTLYRRHYSPPGLLLQPQSIVAAKSPVTLQSSSPLHVESSCDIFLPTPCQY